MCYLTRSVHMWYGRGVCVPASTPSTGCSLFLPPPLTHTHTHAYPTPPTVHACGNWGNTLLYFGHRDTSPTRGEGGGGGSVTHICNTHTTQTHHTDTHTQTRTHTHTPN
jgi:hypothetical protein